MKPHDNRLKIPCAVSALSSSTAGSARPNWHIHALERVVLASAVYRLTSTHDRSITAGRLFSRASLGSRPLQIVEAGHASASLTANVQCLPFARTTAPGHASSLVRNVYPEKFFNETVPVSDCFNTSPLSLHSSLLRCVLAMGHAYSSNIKVVHPCDPCGQTSRHRLSEMGRQIVVIRFLRDMCFASRIDREYATWFATLRPTETSVSRYAWPHQEYAIHRRWPYSKLLDLGTVISGTIRRFLVSSTKGTCTVVDSPNFGDPGVVYRQSAEAVPRDDLSSPEQLQGSSFPVRSILRTLAGVYEQQSTTAARGTSAHVVDLPTTGRHVHSGHFHAN
eukprot:jgi/Ulvmu1/11135/UM071_0018.1